jgi:hypothetical protein
MALGASGASAAYRQAGGLAEMPTRAVTEFMAEAALKNAIAAHAKEGKRGCGIRFSLGWQAWRPAA